MIKAIRAALVLGLALFAAAPAMAQERTDFGPFYVLASEPDRIYLDGPLDEDAADWFWIAISQYLDAHTLVLNSERSRIDESLVIADITRFRRFDTEIPSGATCFYGCALVYLAGVGRHTDGDLVFGTTDVMMAPDIVDLYYSELRRYGVADDVLQRLRDGPPNANLHATATQAAATERSHEEGMSIVPSEDAPRPTLSADENARFEWWGDLETATLREFGPDGVTVNTFLGDVHWSHQDSAAGGIGAVAAIPEHNLALQMVLAPFADPNLPFFNFVMFVRQLDADSSDRTVQSIAYVGAGPTDQNDSQRVFLLSGSREGSSLYGFFMPRILSPFELAALDEFDQISFLMFYEGGGTGMLTLNKGIWGDRLFHETLPYWLPQDHSAGK